MTKKKRDYNGYFSKPVADSFEEVEKLREEVEEENTTETVSEEPVEEEVKLEDVTVVAQVIPNKLNVRIEPQQVEGNVIAILNKGTRVTVHTTYQNPTWAYISAEAEKGINVDGYIMKGFIEEVKEG